MMKVIFATDFYAASVTARALLMRLSWSAATALELLHVLTPPVRVGWFGRAEHTAETLENARRELRSFGRELAARVEAGRGSAQHALLIGDPASTIIERALVVQADLVVIGGPGRAESVTGKLSSLSGAVAGQAHCSVLIARAERVERLVLADGAIQADEAAARIARSPLFRSIPAITDRVADELEESEEFATPTGFGYHGADSHAASALAFARGDRPIQNTRAGLSRHDLVVMGPRPDRGWPEDPDSQEIHDLTGFEGSVLIARS